MERRDLLDLIGKYPNFVELSRDPPPLVVS